MQVKLQKIGNSLGVILPKEVVSRLEVVQGSRLSLSEGPGSVTLSVYDPSVEEEIALGLEMMREYRETFKALAK